MTLFQINELCKSELVKFKAVMRISKNAETFPQ